tara:strand:+ start:2046 stop:2387 length:342 start_codon:yes stop_codon:yes gene_type:complete
METKSITRYTETILGNKHEFILTIEAIEKIEISIGSGIFNIYKKSTDMDLTTSEIVSILSNSCSSSDNDLTMFKEYVRLEYIKAQKLSIKLLVTLFMPFDVAEESKKKTTKKK